MQRQRIQSDGRINASASSSSNSSSVRMEELRDLNKSALSPEEARIRECELQSRSKTIVSGRIQGAFVFISFCHTVYTLPQMHILRLM